ncbi:MAG: 30S ribosomal protein S12 methylthiotransferase RimO [Phycisphaerales bacterium JB043]
MTTMSAQSVSLINLGCPKNTVDSEKMLGLLAEAGLTIVADDADTSPDAIIVNTCGFLEASKQESLDVISEALERKSRGEIRRVIVAGCLVQRHRAKILDWAPGIDAMLGVFDRDRVLDAVTGTRPDRPGTDDGGESAPYWINANALTAARERGQNTVGLTVQGRDGKGIGYYESDSARLRITPRHYAYLRISEGCNQNCAFCTIPSIRGKMRSKPIEKILDEARELLDDGVFELNLIGQDTTSFGDDIGQGLAQGDGLPRLLGELDSLVESHSKGQGWIRLMYAYPSTFTQECIDAISSLAHVVKYIDMPLQHASDAMLTSMRRNVTSAQQRDVVDRLRQIPGMALRTTLISGFPGETEDDHAQLLEFIEDIGFDALGVFAYSHEDGTVAGTMEGDPALAVPEETKQRRRDEIMSLQQRIAFEQGEFLAEQFDPNDPDNSGLQFDILIDEGSVAPEDLDGQSADAAELKTASGRAYFQAPLVDSVTYVQSQTRLAPGELVRCTIVDSDGYDLVARPCEELTKSTSLPIL